MILCQVKINSRLNSNVVQVGFIHKNILYVQTSQSSAWLRQFLTTRYHDALYPSWA